MKLPTPLAGFAFLFSFLVFPVLCPAADKAWDSGAAAAWSAGPWDPSGAPGVTDNVVVPLQYGEARIDSDVVIRNFEVIGFTANWPLRASPSPGAKTLTINGSMSVESGGAARNISFYNNGEESPLNVVVDGDLNLTSDAEGTILQFGDRFGPGDFNDLTVQGTTHLTVLGSRAIALRLNANSARFNGGVVFNKPGGGPVQFTIANDETRPGDTSVAYLGGGDAQSFIQANETGTSTPAAPSAILRITGDSGSTHTFDGILRDVKTVGNSATLGIHKTGSNIQVLTGNSLYTGPTTIDGGGLLINGNQTGATGPVTVAAGATLGGSGTIGGAVTVSGTVSPGSGIGTLTTKQFLTWNGGAGASSATDWIFDLGTGGSSDRLSIEGNFEKGTGTHFRFDFGGSTEPGTFVLIEWTGTTSFSPGDFSYTNLGGGNSAFFQQTGGQLEVVVSSSDGCTPPTELSMSGSGTYCTADGARIFGVTGSTETDVDYELRLDGTPVETVPGTGGSIDFAAQFLPGTYLVVGLRGECVTPMSGDAVIYEAATADAGPDQTVSPNQPVQLAGAVGGTATGGIWSGASGSYDPDASALDAVYTPTPAETGSGSLILTLTTTGQASPCSEAVDTMVITFANVAPEALDQEVVVPTETPTPITLAAEDPDGDSLDFSVIENPAHGSLSSAAPDLVYTPDNGFQGNDSFTFQADDGLLDSNVATVSLTVTDAPAVAGPQGKVYRFYFIGNSLTLGLTTANEGHRARFHGLFKDRGNILHFGTQLGAGVNLDEHWMGIRTFAGDFMKQSYMDDQNEAQDPDGFAGPQPLIDPSFFRDYTFALQGNEAEIDGTVLTGQRFDAVILQPYQSFIEESEYTPADQSDPEGPFGDRIAINSFIDYATGNNPAGHAVTGRFHIYSAWPRLPGIEGKALDPDNDGVFSFEEFYKAPYEPPVNPSVPTQSSRYVPSRDYVDQLMSAITADNPEADIRLIPVGEVAMQLDILIRNGQLPGIETYFSRNEGYYLTARLNGEADLGAGGFTFIYPPGQPADYTNDFIPAQGFKNFYCDGIHMNDQTHNDAESGTLGAYMAAATVYACLTGENPDLHTPAEVAARYEKLDPVQDEALIRKVQEVIWEVVTGDPRTGVPDLPYRAISYAAYEVHHFTYLEREAPGLTGPGDDFDKDGLSNIEEFFRQSDPRTPDPADTLALLVDNTDEGVDVSFTGLANPRGLVPLLESSQDLAGWTGLRTGELAKVPAATAGQIDYSASFPLAGGPQFLRLALSHRPNDPGLPMVDWTANPDIVVSGENFDNGIVGPGVDLATPVNPAIGPDYGNVDSPLFYGATYAFGDNFAKNPRVNDGDPTGNVDDDRIVIAFNKNDTQDDAAENNATTTLIWTQDGDGSRHGFLNGADTGSPTLAYLELRARNSARTTNSNKVRFVIRIGTDFYISEAVGSVASNIAETFLIADPYAVDWFEYDPENDILTMGDPVFLTEFGNITAVGFNWRTYGNDPFRQFWVDRFHARFR